MERVRTAAEVRGLLRGVRHAGKSLGFVPTMGALHDGHASLIRLARKRTECVVVSIFVNPKQFGPSEDYHAYPRDENGDIEIIRSLGGDILFAPGREDLYSDDDRTVVTVRELPGVLCGAMRPGHFDGVCLVVAKLFNIVQPDEAFFGQKDAQQAVIIQRMASDLDFQVRIVLGPTIREPDGLAMSSRNRYLSRTERARAPALYGGITAARKMIERGERRVESVTAVMRNAMEEAGFEVDYAAVVDGCTLRPKETIDGLVLLAAAGRLGRARLIDNTALRIAGEETSEVLLEFPEWSRYDFGS